MKKILNKKNFSLAILIIVVLGITTFLSCKKEVEIKDNFDFKISEIISPENLFLNRKDTIKVRLTPDKKIDYVKYFFSYKLQQGEIKLYDLNDNLINQDEKVIIDDLENFKFKIKSEQTGTGKIKLKFSDTKENVHDTILNFNTENLQIDFQVTPLVTTINLNDSLQIQTIINNLVPDVPNTFQLKYIINSGNGILKDATGLVIQPATYLNVNEGIKNYYYYPSEIGNHQLKFILKDVNGVEIERNVSFNVETVDFNFTATPIQTPITINENSQINFQISSLTQNTNGLNYVLRYEVLGNNAGVLKTSAGVPLNQNTDISLGDNPQNFSYNYFPDNIGTHQIKFTVTNSTGVTKENTVTIEVTNNIINFAVSFSQTQAVVNNPVNVIININSATTNDYTMQWFTTSGNGILKDNTGNIVNQSFYFNINNGSYNYTYIPSSVGTHNLSFELRDQNGQIITRNISLTVDNYDVLFTVSPASNSVFVNTDLDVNVNISSSQNLTGLTMMWQVSGGTGTLRDQGGNIFPAANYLSINQGNFNYTYTPSSVGTHTLTFYLQDDLGNTYNQSFNLDVQNIDFNISITPNENQIWTVSSNLLVINLQEQSPSNTNYQIKYQLISGNGNVKDNLNNVIFPGTWNDINIGQTLWTYTPAQGEQGQVEIKIFVKNLVSNEIKEATATFQVVPVDFNVTANAQHQNIYNNQTNNLIVNLTENPTGSGEPYQVIFNRLSGQGSLTNSSGQPVNFLTWMQISPGTHQWVYQPYQFETGQVQIEVRVKNLNSNVEKTATINFNVEQLPACEISNLLLSSTLSSQQIQELIRVNVVANEQINNNCLPSSYKMAYYSNKNSQILYNNVWYQPGVLFDITPGNFYVDYKGLEVGTHNIEFKIFNQNNNNIISDNIDLVFVDNSFNVILEKVHPNQQEFVNSEIPFDVTIIPQNTSNATSYFVTFDVFENNNSKIIYNNIAYSEGDQIPLNTGINHLFYKGFSNAVGQNMVNLHFENNLNFSVDSNISFYLENIPDFVLNTNINTNNLIYLYDLNTATETTPYNNTQYYNNYLNETSVNTELNFDLIIQRTGNLTANQTYNLRFNLPTGVDGELIYNNTIYHQNEIINLGNNTNVNLTYRGYNSYSNKNLTLEVTNSNANPITHSIDILHSIEPSDYNFNVNYVSTIILQYERHINLNLDFINNNNFEKGYVNNKYKVKFEWVSSNHPYLDEFIVNYYTNQNYFQTTILNENQYSNFIYINGYFQPAKLDYTNENNINLLLKTSVPNGSSFPASSDIKITILNERTGQEKSKIITVYFN